MKDLMTVLAFILMVLAPCLVAMKTGIDTVSESELDDLADAGGDGGSQAFLAG